MMQNGRPIYRPLYCIGRNTIEKEANILALLGDTEFQMTFNLCSQNAKSVN